MIERDVTDQHAGELAHLVSNNGIDLSKIGYSSHAELG